MNPSENQPPISETEMNLIPEEIEKQVPYLEIKDTVESLALEDSETFEFNNQHHYLFLCEKEEEEPIEFIASDILDGFDIYIWESLKEKNEKFLRITLMHELAEITIREILSTDNNLDRPAFEKKSHDIAILYEKRYTNEKLDEKEKKEYEIFANEIRQQNNN